MAPPYSPPRHRPWIIRKPKRMKAAVRPIDAKVGINPIAPVPNPIPLSVTRNVYLRPIRSPIHPNRNAPNGRIRNQQSSDRVGLLKELDRKNCGQAAEDIEVIPFDDVSHRRGDNHAAEIPGDFNCHVRLLLFQGVASHFSALYFFSWSKVRVRRLQARIVHASATPGLGGISSHPRRAPTAFGTASHGSLLPVWPGAKARKGV